MKKEAVFSYGERMVRISFNNSNNAEVNVIKAKFAALIDSVDEHREKIKKTTPSTDSKQGEKLRELSLAITELQSACRWIVGVLTYPY